MDANVVFSSVSEPLLCVPGLMCDARVFADQLAAFPGARCAEGLDDAASLGTMAARALDAAPDRFALLGHSMGARIALEMLRLAPHRVARLALVSTGVHLPEAGEAEKRHALRDIGRARGMAALVDAWLPPMIAQPLRDDPGFVAPLRRMCIEAGLERFEAQIAALLARPEVESLLPTIACPVLVATGSEDRWSPPAQHAAMAALILHAELVIVEGAGHMLPAEAPAALNQAIARWLSIPSPLVTQSGEVQ